MFLDNDGNVQNILLNNACDNTNDVLGKSWYVHHSKKFFRVVFDL